MSNKRNPFVELGDAPAPNGEEMSENVRPVKLNKGTTPARLPSAVPRERLPAAAPAPALPARAAARRSPLSEYAAIDTDHALLFVTDRDAAAPPPPRTRALCLGIDRAGVHQAHAWQELRSARAPTHDSPHRPPPPRSAAPVPAPVPVCLVRCWCCAGVVAACRRSVPSCTRAEAAWRRGRCANSTPVAAIPRASSSSAVAVGW